MGEFYPKKYDVGGSAPQRSSKASGVPAPPPPLSSNTTAGLAGGGDPLPGGKQLAIPGSGGTSGGWRTPGQRDDTLASGSNGGIKLMNPTPVNGVPAPTVPGGKGTTNVTPVAIWQGGPTPGGSDYDQLQAALRARGVLWQRQETYQDGYKFTCSVPNPVNPEFSRIYEATARDYKSALRAVLEQIDQGRGR